MNRFAGVLLAMMMIVLPVAAIGATFENADEIEMRRDSIDIEVGDDVFSSFITIDPLANDVVMIRNQAMDRGLSVQLVGQAGHGSVVIWQVVELEPSAVAGIPTTGTRYLHLVATGPFSAGLMTISEHDPEVRMAETQVMAYRPATAKICVDPDEPGGTCGGLPTPIIVCDDYWTLWCATTALCGTYSKGADGFIDITSGSHRIYWAEHEPVGNWITVALVNGEGCLTYWTPDESGQCPIYASASCTGEGYHVSI